VLAGPVSSRSRTQCASSCRATDKFQYEPGKTYTYDYETQVTSRIHESSAEHAKLRMTATAEFSVLAPCEIVLKVRIFYADRLFTIRNWKMIPYLAYEQVDGRIPPLSR
jgi:hypothetical protein